MNLVGKSDHRVTSKPCKSVKHIIAEPMSGEHAPVDWIAHLLLAAVPYLSISAAVSA